MDHLEPAAAVRSVVAADEGAAFHASLHGPVPAVAPNDPRGALDEVQALGFEKRLGIVVDAIDSRNACHLASIGLLNFRTIRKLTVLRKQRFCTIGISGGIPVVYA